MRLGATTGYAAAAALMGALALAGCEANFEAERYEQITAGGLRAVRVISTAANIDIIGGSSVPRITASGTARASSERALDDMQIELNVANGTLTIEVTLPNLGASEFDVTIQVPDTLPIAVDLSSGNVSARHTGDLDIDVSSGNVTVADAGVTMVEASSGNIAVSDVAALEYSVTSGDSTVDGVAGDVTVGSVGSGNVSIDHVEGSVTISRVGSGNIDARNIAGDFTVGSHGSGNVTSENIGGVVDVD